MRKRRQSRTSLRKQQDVTNPSRETGHWNRRTVLMTVALGGAGVFVGASPFVAPGTAEATETTVEPVYGAGLYDVDPPQGSISQEPNSVVTGDIQVLPEDWGF